MPTPPPGAIKSTGTAPLSIDTDAKLRCDLNITSDALRSDLNPDGLWAPGGAAGLRVARTAVQTIATLTPTLIVWDTVVRDDRGWTQGGLVAIRNVAPFAMLYQVTCNLVLLMNTGGVTDLLVAVQAQSPAEFVSGSQQGSDVPLRVSGTTLTGLFRNAQTIVSASGGASGGTSVSHGVCASGILRLPAASSTALLPYAYQNAGAARDATFPTSLTCVQIGPA